VLPLAATGANDLPAAKRPVLTAHKAAKHPCAISVADPLLDDHQGGGEGRPLLLRYIDAIRYTGRLQ